MFFCRTLFFASFKTEIHSTLHVTASNLFQVVWNACRVVPVMTNDGQRLYLGQGSVMPKALRKRGLGCD